MCIRDSYPSGEPDRTSSQLWRRHRWHLHPNLVEEVLDDTGEVVDAEARLCSTCEAAARSPTGSLTVDAVRALRPRRSLMGGVDFGGMDKLGMDETPSAVEQMMLADERLYGVLVKVVPDSQGGGRSQEGVYKFSGSMVAFMQQRAEALGQICLLYTSPSPRDPE